MVNIVKKNVNKFRRVKKKVCAYCVDRQLEELDYKDINRMRRFITERGKISPRRITGLCPKHQRELASTIKKSRIVGLVPYIVD